MSFQGQLSMSASLSPPKATPPQSRVPAGSPASNLRSAAKKSPAESMQPVRRSLRPKKRTLLKTEDTDAAAAAAQRVETPPAPPQIAEPASNPSTPVQCKTHAQKLRQDTVPRAGAWQPEEESTLMEACTRLHNNWAEVAKLLPDRSAKAVETHWRKLQRRRAADPQTAKDKVEAAAADQLVPAITPEECPDTPVPEVLRDLFSLSQRKVMSRLPSCNVQAMCSHYDPDSYNVMSYVDEKRTSMYKKTLERKIKRIHDDGRQACVLDLGTGGNATLALAAVDARARFVIAAEMVPESLEQAADRLRERFSRPDEEALGRGKKRLAKGHGAGRVALTLTRGTAGGAQTLWLVRGDVTQSISDPAVAAVLDKAKAAGCEFVVVHEIFDDLMSGEDVLHIFGTVQVALADRLGRLPLSVPDNAKTQARCICLGGGGGGGGGGGDAASSRRKRKRPAELIGQLTISGGAIFTHSALPEEWFKGQIAHPLEKADFLRQVLPHAGGGWEDFLCSKKPVGLALSLYIDFGSHVHYDVRRVPNSQWRTCIIGIPEQIFLGEGDAGSFEFSVRMSMEKANSEISYLFEFENRKHEQQQPRRGCVRISAADTTSVVIGAA